MRLRPAQAPFTRRGSAGFTLLEVMVAMAILAVGLTAIFSSEAGAIKVAHRARKMTVATLLARCKMAEIEQLIADEGMPAVELTETDGCCEGGEVDGFECDWIVERLVLPDPGLGDEEGPSMEDLTVGGEGEEGGADALAGSSVEDLLSGATSGGGDMMAEMALSYAYPILKPQLEEQVRRATVTVRWHEGSRPHDFDVVQYLVAEPPPTTGTEDSDI